VVQPEPPSPDRLKGSLETLFRLMGPRAPYTIQWEGIVLLAIPPVAVTQPVPPAVVAVGPMVFATPGMVNVQLTDPESIAIFGPAFSSIPIPIWADASGIVSLPTVGSLVRVGFVNASPSKPYIAGLDPMVLPTVSLAMVLRAMIAPAVPTFPAAATTAAAILNATPVG